MSAIDRLLADLASSRRRMLAELDGFDDARFVERPPGGGWSAGQVVEHLARAESNIVRGVLKSLADGPLAKRTALDALRNLLFYRSGLADIVSVRTSKALDPEAPAARPEALARFAAVRDELVAALEATRGRDVSRLYLRHPFFGAMDLHDMIGFAAWHEERHRRQVVRLRAALGMH